MLSVKNSVLGVAAASFLATGVTVSAADTNYGTRVPSSEEIINALLPQPRVVEATTRAIKFKVKEEKPALTENRGSKSQQLHNKRVAEQTTQVAVSLQVQFEFDSDQLTEQALKQMHPLGLALQSEQLAGITFSVEGHTDAIGTESYNQSLSERRANSIKRHLVSNYEIDIASLRTIGLGESMLLLPDNPSDAANRRVRIVSLDEIAFR